MAATPPTQAAATAAAGAWIDQAAAAREQYTQRAVAQVVASWAAFRAWYDSQQVAAQAAKSAQTSTQVQAAIAAVMAEYIAHVIGALTGVPRIEVPRLGDLVIRNGVDLQLVHDRPAEVYRWTYALTLDEQLAQERAQQRALRLVEDDAMLAARGASNEAMRKLDVTRYRRILRPELAKGGSCALCVVASTRVYRTSDLLPIHGGCNCETLPIAGPHDVGPPINEADLKRLYAAAGSTSGPDLKRVRVQINEHGELGPVLTVRGQRFLTKAERAAAVTPETNKRNLDLLMGNLNTLYDQLRAGDPLDGAIAYQEAQIARLSRAVSAA